MDDKEFDQQMTAWMQRHSKPKQKPKAEFPWFSCFVCVSVVVMIAIALWS